jgi:exonuclease III
MVELRILQYNVHKRRDVMALLLNDPRARSIDIIAVQEPWLNKHSPTTYCPSNCQFLPIFGALSKRSCILVNKKLDINKWEGRITSPDLCSVKIQGECSTTWVYSVYSQPPGSFSTRTHEFSNPLNQLASLLEEEGEQEHIVTGDFNLHHPIWGGIRVPTAHAAADRLIEVIYELGGCQLLTSPGTVTFPTGRGGTTIDLAFGSGVLADRMLECKVSIELDHGSDHLPTLIRLEAEVPEAPARPSRCWKKLDPERAQACMADLDHSRPIRTTDDLEDFSRYLSGQIYHAQVQAVPWRKPSRYANQ